MSRILASDARSSRLLGGEREARWLRLHRAVTTVRRLRQRLGGRQAERGSSASARATRVPAGALLEPRFAYYFSVAAGQLVLAAGTGFEFGDWYAIGLAFAGIAVFAAIGALS